MSNGEAVPAPRQQPEVRKQKAASRKRRRERERTKRAERGPTTAPTAPEPVEAGRRRERQGIVTSDKADKTITVRIDVASRHRTYKKIVRSSTTLHAHDERNDANAGDTVRVVESRPTSATKRWRLVEVTERAR